MTPRAWISAARLACRTIARVTCWLAGHPPPCGRIPPTGGDSPPTTAEKRRKRRHHKHK